MSKRISHKPRFFHHTIEGCETEGQKTELSPELCGLVDDFVQQMIEEYNERKKNCYDLLKRYPNDEGLKQLWTDENIEAFASGADQPHAIEKLRGTAFNEITWHDVSAALEQDERMATLCMEAVFAGAENYIRAGIYASDAVGSKKPFERAQFSYIRNAFIDEWQPRGGIEASLVDMLAQCYVAWQYWLSHSMSAAQNLDSASEQMAKTKSAYDSGQWQPPRITAAEYLERVTQMADRFNRMFLRILRQMRDLRRYASPVIVQNAGQVNIAADGGQQVNVNNGEKRSKRALDKAKRSG